MRFLLPAMLLVAVLTTACGGSNEPAADGRSPGGEASPIPSESTLSGELGGDAQLEGGCAWLDTDSEGRVEPRWPEGYRVAFDPVRLLGPDGEVVAEQGETLEVRGEIAGDAMTICQVGPVLEVSEVVGTGS